eukprot:scaffold22957_cov58-Phaeocystis_antarctica.AAC.6
MASSRPCGVVLCTRRLRDERAAAAGRPSAAAAPPAAAWPAAAPPSVCLSVVPAATRAPPYIRTG